MRQIVLRALAAGLAIALTLLLVEGALRVFPRLLPAGVYGVSGYRSDLQSNVHAAPVIYNKIGFVERAPNPDGYLDVAHARPKPSGVFRVGFFGDSYVEAIQVPLDDVFHRRLERSLASERVEVLGFGMSGWGTLSSYLAYRVESPRHALDAAVYVFVENDLGDNAWEIHGAHSGQLTPRAFGVLAADPPGYRVVLRDPSRAMGPAYQAAKLVQERSLLARLLWNRIVLLRSDVSASSERGSDATVGPPHQDDLPSLWPAEYRARAEQLGARILRSWRDTAATDGRPLLVLYVPRGEEELRGELDARDLWRPWLASTCSELGLQWIDPSAALRQRMAQGDAVYADHWTAAGHEVIAGVLAPRLQDIVRAQRAKPH